MTRSSCEVQNGHRRTTLAESRPGASRATSEALHSRPSENGPQRAPQKCSWFSGSNSKEDSGQVAPDQVGDHSDLNGSRTRRQVDAKPRHHASENRLLAGALGQLRPGRTEFSSHGTRSRAGPRLAPRRPLQESQARVGVLTLRPLRSQVLVQPPALPQ